MVILLVVFSCYPLHTLKDATLLESCALVIEGLILYDTWIFILRFPNLINLFKGTKIWQFTDVLTWFLIILKTGCSISIYYLVELIGVEALYLVYNNLIHLDIGVWCKSSQLFLFLIKVAISTTSRNWHLYFILK